MWSIVARLTRNVNGQDAHEVARENQFSALSGVYTYGLLDEDYLTLMVPVPRSVLARGGIADSKQENPVPFDHTGGSFPRY